MKRVLLLLLAIGVVFASTGCFLFENELMVCEYKPINNYLRYEVAYRGKTIKSIQIFKTLSYDDLNEKSFELQVKELKQKAKEISKEKGVSEEVQVDLKLATIETSIDFDKYDVVNDPLTLFNLEFEKEDFKSIEKLREKINEAGFNCDEIVEK